MVNRLVGLDILKIVLALIVLMFHSVMHLGCNYGILQNFMSMGGYCDDRIFHVVWILFVLRIQ